MARQIIYKEVLKRGSMTTRCNFIMPEPLSLQQAGRACEILIKSGESSILSPGS